MGPCTSELLEVVVAKGSQRTWLPSRDGMGLERPGLRGRLLATREDSHSWILTVLSVFLLSCGLFERSKLRAVFTP